MRIGSNIPEDLWPETYKTTGYLINRTPSSILVWKTPYQMLQEVLKLPEDRRIDHLRIFGYNAYALKHNIPQTHKTEPRAYVGHLVGYDFTNIFRIWVPSRKKVISTRNVTFNETLFYDPKVLDEGCDICEEVEEII